MKKILTIILDGFGIRDEEKGNAIKQAHMNNFNELWSKYPHALLGASEEAVGLAHGQAGNSEVGHMTIGAGRLLKQNEVLVNDFLLSPDMENKNVIKLIENKEKDIHIMGLCSDGNIHAGVDDFVNVYKFLVNNDFKKIHFHLITDGRDTGVHDAMKYINIIKDVIKQYGVGDITSICGRFYAMDRDKRFDRVKLAYDAIVCQEGESFECPVQYVKDSYAKDVLDEFVIPGYNKNVEGTIDDGDSVIFANFRPDRAIQLATVITNPTFYEGYVPEKQVKDLEFVCMMKYADSVNGEIAFVSPELTNTLGDYLSAQGLKQLRIAETEKYAHVTFFFDGGVDKEIEGATRVLVNSPKVATYDLQPEMSAYEVKDKLIAELDKDIHDVVIVNFANCDMVGHTGVIPAAIKAVSVVDECIGEVYEKVLELGGTMLITADHGNAEEELDADGNPFTAHTTNVVPLIVTNSHVGLKEGGKLGDLAPTMLQLLGLPIPEEMDGESLLK